MKDLDERREKLAEDDADASVGARLLGAVRRRPARFLAAAGIAASIVLGVLLSSAHAREKELAGRVDQLEEMYALLEDKYQEADTEEENQVSVITSTFIKSELAGLAELVTQEYIYTNAARKEENKTWVFDWTMPFSSKSILITYDGTIKAGTDLSGAEVEVDEESRTIRVTLPASRITDNIIPQEGIVCLEEKDALFNPADIEDYNELIGQQKQIMEEKVIALGLLEKADREARTVIGNFLSGLSEAAGYEIEVSTGK